MEFHLEDLLISIINITVLFILLRLILWKFINRFLSARAERVRADREDIEKCRLDVDALKQEYEDKLEGIESQGRDILRESQIKASEEADEIVKDAREKARLMMIDARERINEERERAIENTRVEVAQIATDMAARILRREVSSDDSKSAVEDFFNDQR